MVENERLLERLLMDSLPPVGEGREPLEEK